MKNKQLSTVAGLLLTITLGFQACKNEVEIFGEETDVTAVYGLLSADDKVHRIKVNKVFQGTEAVDILAKDPKLSEYENIDVTLLELKDNGFSGIDTLNRWSFVETMITNKDSGVFYYPNQKIYELEQDLNSNYLYAVQVDKLNGSPIVESTTSLLNADSENMLSKPTGVDFSGRGLSLCDKDGPIEKISVEVRVPINAKVVDVFLDFSYQNRNLNFELQPDTITLSYHIGKEIVTNVPTLPFDAEIIELELNPTAFYEFIAANVPVVKDGDDIFQRQPLDIPLNFRFVSGGEEFNTYIEVAAPSTSILETKPEYSNIVNGVGLWSSRSFNEQFAYMNERSVDYLVDGEITAGRRFCNLKEDLETSCY